MFLQAPEASGNPSKFQKQESFLDDSRKHPNGLKKAFGKPSPAFPFGIPMDVAALSGPSYTTAQTLVQQVAYTLSDKLFSYSPPTFALDDAAKFWSTERQKNARGVVTSVHPMETRLGAANVLLGYVFGRDANSTKREVAQSIIASTATLTSMRSAIDQLSLRYSASSPFVAHVAAVDYDAKAEKLVTDYVNAITVAQETGAGLVASFSAQEAQHIALFATLAATVVPTVHVYDGVSVARESTRVADVVDMIGVKNIFSSIVEEQKASLKKQDPAFKVNAILRALNAELGTAYSPFEYEGHDEPQSVLVVFGSVESSLSTQVAASLAKSGEKVGVIAVRVYRPFAETEFIAALPKSVKRVTVLGQVQDQLAVQDQTVQSPLYTDVFAAITMSDAWSVSPAVLDAKYAREEKWSPKQIAWIFEQIALKDSVSIHVSAEDFTDGAAGLDSFDLLGAGAEAKQYVFWAGDESPSAPAAAVVAKLLSANEGNVTFNAAYDNGPLAGTLQTEIRVSAKAFEAPFYIEGADVVVVEDIKLLDSFDIVKTTKPAGKVLLKTNIKDEDLEKSLPSAFRKGLALKGLGLQILDVGEVKAAVEDALVQLAFFKIAGIAASIEKLQILNLDAEAVLKAAEALEGALRTVEFSREWAEIEVEEGPELPTTPSINSFVFNSEKHIEEPVSTVNSTQTAAQLLSFKEAFSVTPALRPDLSVKNYVVRVQENKRLTPDYYDRNIFHIDFDLTGTEMKYEIGEALGIHAHNDAEDVQEFINEHGLNADDIVEVPSKDDPEATEVRTVFQALAQNVDIFGRPPKKFYEALSEFATDAEDRKSLLRLCSAEGAAEFKELAEVHTATYADILEKFKSARPSFGDLARIVGPLKRREYSIASSQKVNPNSVQLLIVVVNWTDTKGRARYGQATRYLSRLPIGAEVTVSVKPSVMKLPTSSTAPLIMAGLGTGLAPFRAFVQYRAWQKAKGIPIGPVLLYMGSRHQREEYLYGEEWEAYRAAGIVTLLGCAFSRDQAKKIYIQDRMRQSMDDIVKAYVEEQGSFYLCGPTWPVPDVAAVLTEAVEEGGKRSGKKVDGRKTIEELKDAGRYVLEVY